MSRLWASLCRWLWPKAAATETERDRFKAQVMELTARVKTLQSENKTLAATVDRLTRQLNAALAEMSYQREMPR